MGIKERTKFRKEVRQCLEECQQVLPGGMVGPREGGFAAWTRAGVGAQHQNHGVGRSVGNQAISEEHPQTTLRNKEPGGSSLS